MKIEYFFLAMCSVSLVSAPVFADQTQELRSTFAIQYIGKSLPDAAGKSSSYQVPLGFTETEAMDFGVDLRSVSNSLNTDHSSNKGLFRGAQEVALFENASPSVVLVLTESGSGSGSLISSDGLIITNWHVVGDSKSVNIVFRPADTSEEVFAEKTYLATVERVDQVRDLALVRLAEPDGSRAILQLAARPPSVGEDVVAIGHPNGYNWTLTKGIVTGLRANHNWRYDKGLQHLADVIQTQTPINPGNSGGPLFNEKMEIVGVNSFGAKGQLTNFAVTAEMVKDFLMESDSRYATKVVDSSSLAGDSAYCKKWEPMGEAWNADDGLSVYSSMDTNCDGVSEGVLQLSTGDSGINRFFVDSNLDGNIDVTLIDTNADYKWDFSMYDVDGDGSTDIVGVHNKKGQIGNFMSHKKFVYNLAN